MQDEQSLDAELDDIRDLPAETKDGHQINLMVNFASELKFYCFKTEYCSNFQHIQVHLLANVFSNQKDSIQFGLNTDSLSVLW
jgi:hypothetical protein